MYKNSIVYLLNVSFRYIFTQILMSAEKKSSIVMLMRFALIPMVHIFAFVKLDTLGMAMTVQVKPYLNGFSSVCRLLRLGYKENRNKSHFNRQM